MGNLLYGTPPTLHEIEDRLLAHLQVVIFSKFRRNESFAFHLEAVPGRGTGRQSLWLNPTIPLQFAFSGSRAPEMNREWLAVLLEQANSAKGLRVVPEPVLAAGSIARMDAVA
ncbi:ATP-dependent DNA ligase [Plantibacter flavus]